jgi:hypothetical protein
MPDSRPAPRIVALELTNRCNIRCPHCPQGKLHPAPPEGFMEEATLLQCLPHCQGYTELNWRGESLLHPRVVEFVGLVKARRGDLDLGVHTNGVALTEDLFHALAQAGLNWLHLSLHTETSCRRFQEVQRWNAALPKPLYIYADTDTTQEDLQARSLGLAPDEYHRDNMANWAGFLTGNRVIHADPLARASACPFLRENLVLVAWDGTVNACCWDFELRHKLGRVEDLALIRHRASYKLCERCLWIQQGSGG